MHKRVLQSVIVFVAVFISYLMYSTAVQDDEKVMLAEEMAAADAVEEVADNRPVAVKAVAVVEKKLEAVLKPETHPKPIAVIPKAAVAEKTEIRKQKTVAAIVKPAIKENITPIVMEEVPEPVAVREAVMETDIEPAPAAKKVEEPAAVIVKEAALEPEEVEPLVVTVKAAEEAVPAETEPVEPAPAVIKVAKPATVIALEEALAPEIIESLVVEAASEPETPEPHVEPLGVAEEAVPVETAPSPAVIKVEETLVEKAVTKEAPEPLAIEAVAEPLALITAAATLEQAEIVEPAIAAVAAIEPTVEREAEVELAPVLAKVDETAADEPVIVETLPETIIEKEAESAPAVAQVEEREVVQEKVLEPEVREALVVGATEPKVTERVVAEPIPEPVAIIAAAVIVEKPVVVEILPEPEVIEALVVGATEPEVTGRVVAEPIPEPVAIIAAAAIVEKPVVVETLPEPTAVIEPAIEKEAEAETAPVVVKLEETAADAAHEEVLEPGVIEPLAVETATAPVAVIAAVTVVEEPVIVEKEVEPAVAIEPVVEKAAPALEKPENDSEKKIAQERSKVDEKEAEKMYANYGNRAAVLPPKVEDEKVLVHQHAGYFIRQREGTAGLGSLKESKMSVLFGVDSGRSRYGVNLDLVQLESGELASSNYGLYGTAGTVVTAKPANSTGGTTLILSYAYEEKNFTFSSMLATTPNTSKGISVAPLFNVGIEGHYDAMKAYGRVIQSSVADSMLSLVGNRDIYTNQVWGRVVKQGVEAGVSVGERYKVALNLGYYPVIKGENTLENSEITTTVSVAKAIDIPSVDKFYAGLLFVYDAYDFDSEYYTYGHGGYFSPQSYLSGGVVLNLTKRFPYGILLDARGSAGYTAYKNDAVEKYPLETAAEIYAADSAKFLSVNTGLFLGLDLSDYAQVMTGAGYRNYANRDEYFVRLNIGIYLDKHQTTSQDFASIDVFADRPR